ncbi:hypothetical protein [Thermomonospora cellulosilytica]|uniref:Uncharacterized protein n=1 Tax=Thermomonospora cellulosilytica TaxID=1411118 RepID=A0A7W3MY75_9ACTN|nr:hypothetical protein [Thermomonospora cellulosilytica]MBA9004113.1 hypothetical protein [Thermomonospora cellulosilytica]
MTQPGMRITIDAAMRARDVSRPYPEGEERPPEPPPPAPRRKSARAERRRQSKRK